MSSLYSLVGLLVLLCSSVTRGQDRTQRGDFPNPIITRKVFMDISMGGEPIGRIEMGLYGNLCPITVTLTKGTVLSG